MTTDTQTDPVMHYLVNFTGVGEPPEQSQIAQHLGDALADAGVLLTSAQVYTSRLGVNPVDVGIKDTWMLVSDDDKAELRQRFPNLTTAIDLICGPSNV